MYVQEEKIRMSINLRKLTGTSEKLQSILKTPKIRRELH